MLRWLNRRHKESFFPEETPISSVRYVVLDTELTSLDNRTNRLLSVGAIAMNGPRIMIGEQFYRLVNPGVPVPAQSVVIHQLRASDVANGKSPAEALKELQTFIDGAVLVGHFSEIDVQVLRKELAAIHCELRNPAICTARVHRWIVRNQRYTEDQFSKLENVDLPSLATVYGLEPKDAHHALDDAFVTARLWQKLIYALDAAGIKTLRQLLKIAGI